MTSHTCLFGFRCFMMDPMSDQLLESSFVPDYDEDLEEEPPCENKVEMREKSQYIAIDYKPTVTSQQHTCRRQRWRPKSCALCGIDGGKHLGRHVMCNHLPWWLKIETACWVCRRQEGCRNSIFKFHCHEGIGNLGPEANKEWIIWSHELLELLVEPFGLESITALKDFVIEHKLFVEGQGSQGFTDTENKLLLDMSKHYKWDAPKGDIFQTRPPNAIASVLHWEILYRLLQHLPEDNRERIHLLCKRLEVIDSHGHLDVMFKRRRINSLKECEDDTTQVRLIGIVSNFVYPKQWAKYRVVSQDPRVKCTFGLHPRCVSSHSEIKGRIRELDELLTLPSCIGLGEIGIEHTGTSKAEQTVQLEFLKEAFKLLKLHLSNKELVLVLHCRDSETGVAAQQTMALLKEMDLTESKIHRHCFSGNEIELQQWCTDLPNCYFGFTETVFRNDYTQAAVKQVPQNRILIESDCPYLSRSPWDTTPVIHKIASLRSIDIATLLIQCNRNASQLYGHFSSIF